MSGWVFKLSYDVWIENHSAKFLRNYGTDMFCICQSSNSKCLTKEMCTNIVQKCLKIHKILLITVDTTSRPSTVFSKMLIMLHMYENIMVSRHRNEL